MYAGKDGYSQADERFFRVFRDQHDREWQSDCEKKTQCPCGPLTLRDPRIKPQIHTPQKYLRVTDIPAGRITIDYDRWITERSEAIEAWKGFSMEQATAMYGTKGQEALDSGDPKLLRLIGKAPPPVQQIQAAQSGNRWVLGLSSARPTAAWVDKYFPVAATEVVEQFPDSDEFTPDAEQKAAKEPARRGRPPKAKEAEPVGAHPSWGG